jgi:PAS domain S-box-containing protein
LDKKGGNMRDSGKKITIDYEKRVNYLESKLKSILTTINFLNEGNLEGATNSLNSYNRSTEQILLNSLINKIEELNAPKVNPEDKSYAFLKIILNSIPFPVFIKDEKSRYLLINSQEEELFGIKESEILGKHDSDFVHNDHEMAIIQESDNLVLIENTSIELPNQNFSVKNGKSFVFKTHKMPFINPLTGKRNLLGFSVDITDTVNLDKLKKILIMNSPYL